MAFLPHLGHSSVEDRLMRGVDMVVKVDDDSKSELSDRGYIFS